MLKSLHFANFVVANLMPIFMKRLFLTFITLAALCLSYVAKAQNSDTLFPYPTAPEDIPTLTGKCNYLVYNFWDRCNIKQSFSSLKRLNDAFGTWAGFMPYATADTVHLAIDNYINKVEKEDPKSLVEVGKMARHWFHCDSAEYYSDEVYMQFCEALAKGKKVPNAEKARYAAEYKVLSSSTAGQKVPPFKFVAPDGEKMDFGSVIASRIVLFINDPDCFDCTLAKARLAADNNTNSLIENGLLKVVSIYPDAPTPEWKEAAASYPSNWIVGASENLDEYFYLDVMPAIYWLDGRHKVLGKEVPIDNMIFLLQQINSQQIQ